LDFRRDFRSNFSSALKFFPAGASVAIVVCPHICWKAFFKQAKPEATGHLARISERKQAHAPKVSQTLLAGRPEMPRKIAKIRAAKLLQQPFGEKAGRWSFELQVTTNRFHQKPAPLDLIRPSSYVQSLRQSIADTINQFRDRRAAQPGTGQCPAKKSNHRRRER
jgi:hypothetical protein